MNLFLSLKEIEYFPVKMIGMLMGCKEKNVLPGAEAGKIALTIIKYQYMFRKFYRKTAVV